VVPFHSALQPPPQYETAPLFLNLPLSLSPFFVPVRYLRFSEDHDVLLVGKGTPYPLNPIFHKTGVFGRNSAWTFLVICGVEPRLQ